MPMALRHSLPSVYVLYNSEAGRSKVGITINSPSDRLRTFNYLWSGITGTCQICGGRRDVDTCGFIPKHIVSGRRCHGSNFLPLEKNQKLAASYVNEMKASYESSNAVGRSSLARRIKKLEQRIEKFKSFKRFPGFWRIHAVYETGAAETVEKLTHKNLSNCLDDEVPFGEVFNCSGAEASKAVEEVLMSLGLPKAPKMDEPKDENEENKCDDLLWYERRRQSKLIP